MKRSRPEVFELKLRLLTSRAAHRGAQALIASLFATATATATAAAAAPAFTEVSFASFDKSAGQPVILQAFWALAPVGTATSAEAKAKAKAKAKAVVLLHGCGGLYNAKGELSARFLTYVELLSSLGIHALVLDSLTPRGERELCTQKIGARRVTVVHRRADALAAVQWLSQQPQVDAKKIGLVGWSNGGSAVLSATNERHADVAAAAVKANFAVAFYPGCEAELKRGYQTSGPLLLLVGEADDWTPAAPCKQLAAQAHSQVFSADEPASKIEIEAYADAFHGFDSTSPLRLRKDVPNGVNPGQGVTVGGNAQALQKSRERLIQFLDSR